MCAVHDAELMWSSREPKPPTIDSPYEWAIARAALSGDNSLSLAPLAGLAAPTTQTLQ
jgi:hypothetical protein